MMNNMPYQMPNFMPYDPNISQNPNNNDNLNRELDKINRELELIEKRLERIENTLNNKTSNYLSSNVESGKGLYML